MIRQFIYLPGYRWMIIVFYWAGRGDADEILQTLQRFACSEEACKSAERNLRGEVMDTGLTYTNNSMRATVMAISESSSPEEFWNTMDHEKGHAVQHIGSALGLDYLGEAQQYLAGTLAKEMYPIARQFICEGC